MKLTEEEKQNFEGIIDYLISDCAMTSSGIEILEAILILYHAGLKNVAYLAYETLAEGGAGI